MPIKDPSGKVIVSLLAGATAGIITGLLLAPETGEDTRKTLAEEANKLLGGSFGQQLKAALARFTGPAAEAPAHPDQQAAEDLLRRQPAAPEPGDLTAPAGAGNGRSVAGDASADDDKLRL